MSFSSKFSPAAACGKKRKEGKKEERKEGKALGETEGREEEEKVGKGTKFNPRRRRRHRCTVAGEKQDHTLF